MCELNRQSKNISVYSNTAKGNLIFNPLVCQNS